MLKKSIAFGLLAAGLMIAPTAALAGEQVNTQNTVQNGSAYGRSSVYQNSTSDSVQIQNRSVGNGGRYGKYGRYQGRRSCNVGNQDSVQNTEQNAAAEWRSNVRQTSGSNNTQIQRVKC